MSYQLTSEYVFERTVEVRRPSPVEKDKILIDKFTAQFVAVDPDELDAFEDAIAACRTVKESIDVLVDFGVKITKGWSDVVDENRAPVPFDPETYRAALRRGWFRDGVIGAYRTAMRGEEARLGN